MVTPFFTFYTDKTMFELTPRVFSYLCFVHVLGKGQDKLDSRVIKCVFLGYSRTHMLLMLESFN